MHQQQQEKTDHDFMALARAQAYKSYENGSFPIGSVLVRNGEVIAEGRNKMLEIQDITSHSELECLRASGLQETFIDTILYTTLSPCLMCTGAILQFKIPRVVIGNHVTIEGNEELLRHKGVEVVILDDQECQDIVLKYSKENVEKWTRSKGDFSKKGDL